MKIKKLLLTFVGLSTLMLGACGKTPEPEHEHKWSTAWTSNATDHWHQCTGCDEETKHEKHKINEYGFCSVCNYFVGEKANLNANIAPVMNAGEYVYKRVPLGADSEYGILALFNDDIEAEVKCEMFVLVNKTPTLIQTAYDYDILLLHFPANADNRNLYLRFSFEGTLPTYEAESFKISSLVHGCDSGNWYYGLYDNDLADGDSCDFEDPDKHINGKYYVAFAPVEPDDTCYEITVDCADGGAYTLRVFQDQSGSLVNVATNGLGRYLPDGANELIIEIETSTPGSQVDVSVAVFAR